MLGIALLSQLLSAQVPDTTIIRSVREDLARAPLEVFGKDTGRATVGDVALLDIDGDGTPEAFVAIHPTFRKTPTVVVYKYLPAGPPHRLFEALAPGRIGHFSGRLTDAHSLGRAMDMTIGRVPNPLENFKFVTSLGGRGSSVVRYPTFYHIEIRDASVNYVDLSDRKVSGDATTCAGLDFSPVDGLVSGRLVGDTAHRYLVALTAKDIAIYRFDGIGVWDMLLMQTWMRDRPKSATGVVTAADDQVSLVMRDGTTVPLEAP